MIEHRTTVRVRYRDTDQMGVVYHGVYLEFFETGRTELLRAVGLPYSTIEREEGVMLPVLDIWLSIAAPARYDDLLEVVSTIEPIEGARLSILYRIEVEGRMIVAGRTTHAFVSADTMRPVRPPRRFLDAVAGS